MIRSRHNVRPPRTLGIPRAHKLTTLSFHRIHVIFYKGGEGGGHGGWLGGGSHHHRLVLQGHVEVRVLEMRKLYPPPPPPRYKPTLPPPCMQPRLQQINNQVSSAGRAVLVNPFCLCTRSCALYAPSRNACWFQPSCPKQRQVEVSVRAPLPTKAYPPVQSDTKTENCVSLSENRTRWC
jgi:hypothetical protein